MKTKLKTDGNLPKILKAVGRARTTESFPLSHYSYSTFVKFCTNPILFKINYINGQRIDTLQNVSGVIGQSFHGAMERYYTALATNREDPVKEALEAGLQYLDQYPEGFVEYSTATQNKQKAKDTFTFAFNAYVLGKKLEEGETLVSCEEMIEEDVDVEWNGQRLVLPVRLKGYLDKLVRDKEGRLKIKDYKTVRAFSDPEKIDGAKIIQSIQYYLLVYAKYGEAPYSITYEEVKVSKNRDGGSQIREYEMVYAENEKLFDFYFRLYDDMTRAINGEAVFVPNIYTIFDNEVSIIAYINRLDVPDEAAKLMREMRVNSITDLLKKKIENAGSMRKFLKSVEKKFVSASGIKYELMNMEDKIKTKFMEHGMLLQFEDKVEGHSVDLYRFNPSIGLKMSKILGYVADIEQVVGVSGVRVLAPIPNTTLVGFEVPRAVRTYPGSTPSASDFNLAIGVDVMGNTFRFDIRNAPHLLIAGATGSGKSVFLNSILSQLSNLPNVDLHLFDPKIVELSAFSKGASQYYTDPTSIYLALEDLVVEMNNRYKVFSETGARNIAEYSGKMNYKFIVIDEFGDLVVGGFTDGKVKISKEISRLILTLAQKARAAGIHIIIATQRPSTDIITGTVKANFPTKVAFRTAKVVDSLVLIDEPGAEKLLGKGDMIFSSDQGRVRLQGFSE